jgi:hypothetical protein
LAELMCDPEQAPFVAQGLINNGRLSGAERDGGLLIAKLRDPRSCPGAVGLTEEDFRNIRRIESQVQRLRQRQQNPDAPGEKDDPD